MEKITVAYLLCITLLTGAGCAASTSTNNVEPEPTDQVGEPGSVASGDTGWLETNEPLAAGEIGFTVNPPPGWGTFSVVLHKISFPTNPELGDTWEYRGWFSQETAVIYRAADPEHVMARGGYTGDVLGYEKRIDGYYILLQGKTAQKVPEALVYGEVPLANGMALLLLGTDTDGPSPFPNEPGQLVAYLNTPNGPLPGGVFMTNFGGPVISPDKMLEMLATVTIK